MIIKTRRDAENLAKAFVEESPKLPRRYLIQRDEDRPYIQVVNNSMCCISLVYVETDEETIFPSYKIAEIDTVYGSIKFQWVGFNTIKNRLFRCREYINQSGQISDL